jgi:maleate isomerase
MHHFGVLVPSTNTIVEIEYGRLLPPNLQHHVARIPLLSRGAEIPIDVGYQARLLGTAKVEVVALAQTGVSLTADDYDERITKRMSEAADVPAITSARAIGLAVRALGARRIALVSPYPIPVLERAKRHYADKYGLEVVAIDSFSGAESTIYPTLGPHRPRSGLAWLVSPCAPG